MKKVLSLAAVFALAACGGRTAGTSLPAGMGGVRVQMHATTPGGTTMGEIIIQNVFDPAQTSLLQCVAKPELLNGQAFCDEMSVLPPGVYEIKVESQTGCEMTQDHYKAVVNAGQTTEVQINLVCNAGGATGGLDVVVTENHFPQVDHIGFSFLDGSPANKFMCANSPPVVITLQIEDAETACASLTADWSVNGVVGLDPPIAFVERSGVPQLDGSCILLEVIEPQLLPPPAPGTQTDIMLDVLIGDGTLTTTFNYPIHIINCP